MATVSTHNPPSKRNSHINTTYNYSSPTLKRAMKPVLNDLAPSTFKYYPILSNCHLKIEPYCDTCWAMKGTEQSGYDSHLRYPHNYPCPNEDCSLEFVEQKHLLKHFPICAASLLLLTSRKIREQTGNEKYINFKKDIAKQKYDRKQKKNTQQMVKSDENKVWITCYPNQSYCAEKLRGYDSDNFAMDISKCTDPTYIDPKNNPPYPSELCYFQSASNANTNTNSSVKHRSFHDTAIMERKDNDDSESESDSDSDSESQSSSSSDSATVSERSDSDSDGNKHNTNYHSNNSNNQSNNHESNPGNNNGNGGNNPNIRAQTQTQSQSYQTLNDTIMTDLNVNINDTNYNGGSDNSSLTSLNTFPTNKSSEVSLNLPYLGSEYSLPTPTNSPLRIPLPPSMQRLGYGTAGMKRKANALYDTPQSLTSLKPPTKKQRLLPQIPAQSLHVRPVITYNDNPLFPKIPSQIQQETQQNLNGHRPVLSTSDNSKYHSHGNSHSNVNGIWNRLSTNTDTDTDAHSTKSHSQSRKRKREFGIKTTHNSRKKVKIRKKKKAKSKPKEVIDLIGDSDEENQYKCVNNSALKQRWKQMTRAEKYKYIIHPYHIYTVSQQFVWKKDTKSKKSKKNKHYSPDIAANAKIECFKMHKCTTEWTERDLNQRWKVLQAELAQKKKNNNELFTISDEFLNFVGIIPKETGLKPKNVMSSVKVNDLLQKLYMSDHTHFKYLQCYNPKQSAKMKALLHGKTDNLSFNSQIFLYSFLRCGVGLFRHGFNPENVTRAKHIHDAYYAFLNNKFRDIDTYQSATLRDIECKTENACFKEFIFRNHHNIQNWRNCTLDLSLKMGGVLCNELENLLEQNESIQSLKTLYNCLYPHKQLRLVNIGFFQSPHTNPGQNWHTDFEFTSISEEYTKLSPVVTVVISLVKQEFDGARTKGSTVFCLGSNHTPTQVRIMCDAYPDECKNWLYRIVQPVLERGDIACFAGHTLHFGGAYEYMCKELEENEDRVLCYGVLHLLDKTAAHDSYLETDMNIFDGKQAHSLFGGGRWMIVRRESEESKDGGGSDEEDNPYEVKKNRRRNRMQFK